MYGWGSPGRLGASEVSTWLVVDSLPIVVAGKKPGGGRGGPIDGRYRWNQARKCQIVAESHQPGCQSLLGVATSMPTRCSPGGGCIGAGG